MSSFRCTSKPVLNGKTCSLCFPLLALAFPLAPPAALVPPRRAVAWLPAFRCRIRAFFPGGFLFRLAENLSSASLRNWFVLRIKSKTSSSSSGRTSKHFDKFGRVLSFSPTKCKEDKHHEIQKLSCWQDHKEQPNTNRSTRLMFS